MSEASTGLRLSTEGGIGRIFLDRPERGNAVDVPLAKALLKVVASYAADPAIRVVGLSGCGKLFCAGGDVRAMAASGDAGLFLAQVTDPYHAAILRLVEMPKPLVVAVNGPAAGAGLNLAALGDVVLAARSSSFVTAYSGVGLSPDGGTTWLLPRLIGLRRAQELILTNRRLGAEEAAEWGLVTRVVDDEALMTEFDATLTRMAAMPTLAIGRARALLRDSFASSLAVQLAAEAQGICASALEPDGQEGIAAFAAGRRPVFVGV